MFRNFLFVPKSRYTGAVILQEHVPLAPMTTFGVGGPARYFAEAQDEDDVVMALAFAKTRDLPVFILGGGSNLLVSDLGFPGMVLKVGAKGVQLEPAGDNILLTAAAGEDWDRIVASCVETNLGGVECLSGIPGFVGGTPVQNVGAYGQETADTLISVRALDRESEEVVELTREQCGFAYRTSIFNTTHRDRYIVLQVTYSLRKNGIPLVKYPDLQRSLKQSTRPPTLSEVRSAVLEIRASKAMLIVEGDPDCRSAGSFFKNPIITNAEYARLQSVGGGDTPGYPAANGNVKTSAAWLIEHAGFAKGFALGPAAVSRKHTLALVNTGGARAADIVALAREIRRGVYDRFGIRITPEPVFVGFIEDF
jgi:UDP-N-acetylmuramate dehydrogenase